MRTMARAKPVERQWCRHTACGDTASMRSARGDSRTLAWRACAGLGLLFAEWRPRRPRCRSRTRTAHFADTSRRLTRIGRQTTPAMGGLIARSDPVQSAVCAGERGRGLTTRKLGRRQRLRHRDAGAPPLRHALHPADPLFSHPPSRAGLQSYQTRSRSPAAADSDLLSFPVELREPFNDERSAKSAR